MKQNAYLYCDPRSLNEATKYYVGLIGRTLIAEGYIWNIVHRISEIKDPKIIVTITEKYFLLSKLRFPRIRTIYWAQGISAEEAKICISGITSRLRYVFRKFVEPFAIKRANILFCVSNRMVRYYRDNYKLSDNGQIIVMPCYNLQPTLTGDIERYNNPTFVYAGNISQWQCIDTMLKVYAKIENKLPSAKFIIFTGDKEKFVSKIESYGIKKYELKYVPVEKLHEEMLCYKYGFVIRDDHIINQVATPTKLNSYLSAYLIPIFSDGVDAFSENIKLGDFTIMAQCPLDENTIAEQIINFETKTHNFSNYPKIVRQIFNQYYNDGIYEQKLKELLQTI